MSTSSIPLSVAAAEPEALQAPAPAETVVALVEKHPRAIRWMHWINFPLLALMIWSGLLIYWGDSIPPFQHPHQVYRIGIGHWTLFRFFPDWFWKWLNAPYRITVGLGWHFLLMWFFAANGIAYFIYLCVSGEWRVMVPHKRSLMDAMWVTLYDLHIPFARRRGLPPQGKYNGGQRIAYTAVVIMGGFALLTGVAIYKPAQAHLLTSLFGGYEMARFFHFWLTIGFCGFFVVHVGQVVLAGWNNFRSMVTGFEIQRRTAMPVVAADMPVIAATSAAAPESSPAAPPADAAMREAQTVDVNTGEPTGAAHEDMPPASPETQTESNAKKEEAP